MGHAMSKNLNSLLLAGCLVFANPCGASAQNLEVGFLLGTLRGGERSQAGVAAKVQPGLAWQANAAWRLAESAQSRFSAEVHFLANPQRKVSSASGLASTDIASLYLVPGLRWKLLPQRRWQPYASAGAGFAAYESSLLTQNGSANSAPRLQRKLALSAAGGVDVQLRKWFAWRAELRNFWAEGVPLHPGGLRSSRQNLTFSTGFVLTR